MGGEDSMFYLRSPVVVSKTTSLSYIYKPSTILLSVALQRIPTCMALRRFMSPEELMPEHMPKGSCEQRLMQ